MRLSWFFSCASNQVPLLPVPLLPLLEFVKKFHTEFLKGRKLPWKLERSLYDKLSLLIEAGTVISKRAPFKKSA
jgi:hypothetical protein